MTTPWVWGYVSAHTSLFTGTYPHTHGVVKNGYAVHPDNLMLPELLTERGFRCAGFVGAAPLSPEIQFDQGFHHYDAEFSEKTPTRQARVDDRRTLVVQQRVAVHVPEAGHGDRQLHPQYVRRNLDDLAFGRFAFLSFSHALKLVNQAMPCLDPRGPKP